MSPWTKRVSRQRTAGASKFARPASGARRREGGGLIFVSDPDLLKKYPWLLACDNVRTDRS